MRLAVKAIVHPLQHAETQPLRNHRQVLEGQMVPKRVVRYLDSGMVVIGRTFLAFSEALLRDRVHVIGYTQGVRMGRH